MPGPGVFPGMGDNRRFPGRRGRRPLRGWPPVDGLPRELAAGCGHSLMGRSVGRGLDPSVGVCGRHRACPPPRGRGRACPARGFSREWATTGGFRGVGDAAPYVGGRPLTGGRANLRRGVGTPPYGCNSRKCCRGRHSLMGRFVGRGLDPSVGVCGRHRACPPPRGRGRACPAPTARRWASPMPSANAHGGVKTPPYEPTHQRVPAPTALT